MVDPRSMLLLVLLAVGSQAFVPPSQWLSCESVSSVVPSLSCAHKRQPVMLHTLSAESETEVQKDQGTFDWFKAWYPVVPVEILDPEKPHKFQLLGQDIVIWNDGKYTYDGVEFGPKKNVPKKEQRNRGKWRAFVDECPHRKVPLSEGRVEVDGSLLCSYHGWRFDGEGSCVAVPQIANESELERVLNNPKTSCNSFPTKIINGLLFVWPSADKDAVLESEVTPVAHRPRDEQAGDRLWEGPWNFRELPYGADFFIENVVDPAHVTVSHHGVVGSRYGDQTLMIKPETPVTKNGFSFRSKNNVDTGEGAAIIFKAPSMVAIDADFGDGARQTLELYVSPSQPGFCNHVGRMVILKDQTGKMPKLLSTFTAPIPKWLNHILASAFLNQDALFLHHQERSMAKTNQYKSFLNGSEQSYHYTKAVYPVNSDQGVINFRNWMRKLGGGKIPYKNQPTMPPASNKVVFDVWNAHTKHCRYCQDALRRLKKFRFAAFFVATCLGVLRPMSKVANLASTLATAGTGLLLHKLIGMFYKYETSHAHND